MKHFKDKVAVITGGGSGIGKALALAAAKRGMQLALLDIQSDALAQCVDELRQIGVNVMGITADVSDSSAMQTVADQIEKRYGAIHLVFNNAGVTSSGPVWESTEKDWDWLLGINLKGVINGVRSFTPKMLAAAAADNSYEGCMVNTASLAGILAGPGMGIYSVSKHAVVALSECLHYDLQLVSPQVKAAVLCPSYVPTAIGNSDRNRPKHLLNEKRPTKAQMASLAAAQQAVAQGNITAQEVAEITFAAVEDGSFYIFPSPEPLALFKLRSDNILNQVTPEFPYDLFPALKDRRDRMLAAQAQA
jgi:NAD(P)-dependent dehydrogenase (short-subunit alcohol dehydrogenase family)